MPVKNISKTKTKKKVSSITSARSKTKKQILINLMNELTDKINSNYGILISVDGKIKYEKICWK